jgi:hypothetical protein
MNATPNTAVTDYVMALTKVMQARLEHGALNPDVDRVTVIAVKMGRDGRIMNVAIDKSSGDAAVDADILSRFHEGDTLLPMPTDVLPSSSSLTIREPIRYPARASAPTNGATDLTESDLNEIESTNGPRVAGYCGAQRNDLMGSIMNYRLSGLPLAEVIRITLRTQTPGDDIENRFFLKSIGDLYRDPDAFQRSVSSGAWSRACVATLPYNGSHP